MPPCMQLWLELSRIFLAQQQLDDARFCVRQAKNGTPWSPAAHHMAGRVLQVSLPAWHALVLHSACWWLLHANRCSRCAGLCHMQRWPHHCSPATHRS